MGYIIVNDYESFKSFANSVSVVLKKRGVFNIVKIRECKDYDWFYADYMVDAFGGDAFTVGNYQGKWYRENWTNHNGREYMESLKDCFNGIVEALQKKYASRDLDGLYSFVNSQNED